MILRNCAVARSISRALRRAAAVSIAGRARPGYDGRSPSAMITRTKASTTAGFVAVSLVAATAAAGAPAIPLLKCSPTSLWRLAANSASARRGC